jgi:hypothetical protein
MCIGRVDFEGYPPGGNFEEKWQTPWGVRGLGLNGGVFPSRGFKEKGFPSKGGVIPLGQVRLRGFPQR